MEITSEGIENTALNVRRLFKVPGAGQQSNLRIYICVVLVIKFKFISKTIKNVIQLKVTILKRP